MGSTADVELAACGLSPSLLDALVKAGFRYKADVAHLSPRQLSNEADISFEDAVGVLQATVDVLSCSGSRTGPRSALELLKEQESLPPISLLVPTLDDILGGGLPRREITELCGAPGTGKTQIGLHACIAAQCQFSSDPTERTAVVYIDTEGSFVIERVAAMAEAMCSRRLDLTTRGIDRDELLRGIIYYRAHDFVDQLEILQSLGDLIHSRPQIKLVVIDSIAFHFRHGFEDFSHRARAMDSMASLLQHLAISYDVSILVVNQVTSRAGGLVRGASAVVPALGESWSYAITNRVLLSWEGDARAARITKSSSLAQGTANFIVTSNGIENA